MFNEQVDIYQIQNQQKVGSNILSLSLQYISRGTKRRSWVSSLLGRFEPTSFNYFQLIGFMQCVQIMHIFHHRVFVFKF